jgi:hypothetical protein
MKKVFQKNIQGLSDWVKDNKRGVDTGRYLIWKKMKNASQ